MTPICEECAHYGIVFFMISSSPPPSHVCKNAACYIKEIYVVVIISDREFSLPEPSAKQIANKKNSFPPLQILGRGIILEVDP